MVALCTQLGYRYSKMGNKYSKMGNKLITKIFFNERKVKSVVCLQIYLTFLGFSGCTLLNISQCFVVSKFLHALYKGVCRNAFTTVH
jgi:hypothetical protein